ncbi:MAG: hypothetical protein ACRDTO_00690 [Mycobacterium sp.]
MTEEQDERLRTDNDALIEEMLERKRLALRGCGPPSREASGPATAPPRNTGDPWIDAYLELRAAWCAGMAPADLVEFARELRLALPPGPPSVPADIFVRMDAAMADTPVDVLLAPGSPLWTPNK